MAHEVRGVVDRYTRYRQREADLAAAQDLLADPELAGMAREEITAATADLERLLRMTRRSVPEGVLSAGLGNAFLALGEALAGLGRRDEARTALDEALEHLEDAGGPTHPGTVRARALRGRL